MNILSSAADFERSIQELRETFPWVGDSVIRPGPGHVGTVHQLFTATEEIVGREALSTGVDFLRIELDRERSLKIYFELNGLSGVRRNAFTQQLKLAIEYSTLICAACGGVAESDASFCTKHRKAGKLFADGGVFDELQTEQESTDDFFDAARLDDCQPEDEEDYAEAESDSPAVAMPTVALYSMIDVDMLGELGMHRGDSTERQRTKKIVERLRLRGEHRLLAVIPDAWEEKIAELARQFPNFSEVVQFVRNAFALSALADGRVSLKPILLDGPPGVGKTQFCHALAKCVETSFTVVNMASAQTGSTLSGSEKHWGNTDVGELFRMLTDGDTANPIILLDELDKTKADGRYDPAAALYQLLEPVTAAAFRDLSVPTIALDARHVLWMATSNDQSAIAEPILSRLTSFSIEAPDRAQTRSIAKSIYLDIRSNASWGHVFSEEVGDAVLDRLDAMSPRELRKTIDGACGRAAIDGRTELRPSDVVPTMPVRYRTIGFIGDGLST